MKKKVSFIIVLLIFILSTAIFADEFRPIQTSVDDYVYKIGSNDELEINVWGYDNLTKKVVVRPDGMITYEMVGDVHAAGLTPTQLGIKLSQNLSNYLREPKVIVKVIEIKSQKVVVNGDIPKIGTVYLRGPMHLLDLLTECGYNSSTSSAKEVILMRKGNTIRINLSDLVDNGDISKNIMIKSGDYVILPKTVIGTVIVDGEVSKPGKYEIKKGEKILVSDLIRLSGGLTQSAVLKRSKIIRKSGQELRLNLEPLRYAGVQVQNYVLNDGDRLVIPRVKTTKIYVFGEVEKVGIVKIDDPQPNVAKLITKARDKYFAVLSNVKIIRENPLNPGYPIVFNIDLKKVIYRNDPTQNIRLQNNDVVYLPQSWLGSFTEFLDEVWPTVRKASDAIEDAKEIKKGNFDEVGEYNGRF